MRVLLLRDSRIKHSAGEIIDVSPAEARFLLSVGSAVELHDEVQIETPEDIQVVEIPETVQEVETPETVLKVEIPEKKKTSTRKTKK